jgi:hypothetical protein
MPEASASTEDAARRRFAAARLGRGRRRGRSKEALLPLGLTRAPCAGVDLGTELRRELGAALNQRGRLVGVDGAGTQVLGQRL